VSTPDYPRREVFPYAPLQLVAAEVRYPYAPRLRQIEVLDALQIDLEELLPIRRTMQQLSLELDSSSVVNKKNEEVFRLFNRTSTASAAITPIAVTVETTGYTEFGEFGELVRGVLAAVADRKAVVAVERIGLRYIDEVRVPAEINSARDWEGWLSDDITAVSRISPDNPTTYQGAIEVTTGQDQKLVFRFAALDGAGVVLNEPLRRRNDPTPGPFFVIDIDSFWAPGSPENYVEFDVDFIGETLASLHAPTGTVFQAALTDKLRTLFRKGSL
jgi:uncharacterized protein (TIGR04255 family)